MTVLNGARPPRRLDYYCCGSFISAGRETAADRLEVDGIRLHNDNAADDLRSHLFADPTEVGFEQPAGNAISFSSYLNQKKSVCIPSGLNLSLEGYILR